MRNLSTATLSTNSSVHMQNGEETQIVFTTKESATGMKNDNVYITPSYIRFKEAFEGITYRQRITIKNVGYKPAFVKIRPLNSIAFQVKSLKTVMRVSPGLSITTYVTYTFKRTSLLHAIIPIEINGKVFDYRVTSILNTGHISIEPKSIDFGTIDIGYSSGSKVVTIRNEGGKSTRFSIDLGQNNLDVTVKPLRGRIRPQEEVKLRVELMGMNEGVFYSEFWIKSTPNIRVPIKAYIIIPGLVVYHPNTTGDFTLIDFPPTIENTSRYDTFVLRNLSSRVSSYVVLGELDNEVKCIRDIDRKHYPAYSAFEIRPLEGRMSPFQGIIFEVKFSPTILLQRRRGRKQRTEYESEHRNRENRDFMAFIRIVRIHYTESENIVRIDPVKDFATDSVLSQSIYIQETTMETSSSSTSCVSSLDAGTRDVIRLCLYGEAETIQLYLEPDALYFGDLIIGQISQRVLRLTNPSAIAPIYLEYVPNAAARCYPNCMKLKSKTSIEVLIKVCGKENIEPSFKLFFNVMVDSYDPTASSRRLEKMKVGSCSVECTVNIIFKSKRGLLSKRSLPMKVRSDNAEIMERVLRPPKWKQLCKNYSETIDRFVARRLPHKEPVSTTKAAVLIPLSPLQIYNVHINPITFAFGMVAPNSFNYRRLIVKNTNNIPVMIRLISLSIDYIHFPEGDLMILQPDSTMTKLVEYFAVGIGKFKGYINYVINDNHSFELNVTADVVHKQLYIDKRETELGKEWSSEETYRPMASVVRITNKLGANIRFRWEVPATSGFYIEPRVGSVRGNATLYVYAYYEPNDAKSHQAQAMMTCESGSCVSLQLSAPRFAPRVEFVYDSAHLGEIPLNLPTKVIAILQNFDFNEVMYEVDDTSLIRGCDVNPSWGRISPRGIAILEVYLTFDVCCRFSTMIAVTIQGCRRLLYKINGNVSFPRLKILPRRIDMKRISIDASRTHRITATNIGTTTLRLRVLLDEYPEFRVSWSADGKNSDIDTEGVTIVPGASRSLHLHFQPVDLASYAFYLPIVINELLSPVSMTNPKSLRPSEFLKSRETHYAHLPGFIMTPLPDKLPTISIDCTVAGRIIFFSKLAFQFNTTTNELSEELCIENRATPREVEIFMNNEEFNEVDCPFTIEWSRGAKIKRTYNSIECTLCIGDSVFFVLEFKPKKRGSFIVEAPIYVRGEVDNGVFNKLRLDGEFPAASIDVEPTEIYFTPVPLGTAIEEKFRIRARHFDNATFIRPNFPTAPRCSGDYKDELLRIEFLNGNIVPLQSYVELEAKITFRSDQPVSFCSIIEFWDNSALCVCFLTVHATADNSLLTTYMYPIKSSSIFDEMYARYSEKHIPDPSISSDSAMDEDDPDNRRISHIHKRIQDDLFESRFNVATYFDDGSRSPVEKNVDSRSHCNGKINANDDGINDQNKQVDRKWPVNDDSKRIPIRRKQSAFSIDYETRKLKRSERLSHLYHSTNNRSGDCEKHMQRIITIAEEWMYSDPLKFYFYPSIPHGITAAFSSCCIKKELYVRNSKQKSNIAMPSFVDVLKSLVTSDRDYLGIIVKRLKQPLPENDVERINYVLQLYNKMLDFLLSQGAYLIHVPAHFLLNYDDYLISIDIVQSNIRRKELPDATRMQCERLSRQLFESRNRRCWLDVILQTYKCLVLRGIHENKFRPLAPLATDSPRRSTMYRESIVSSTLSLPKQYELHERTIRDIANLPSVRLASDDRCPEERFLLDWLQCHYEQQRVRDWMADRRVILNPREKRDVAKCRAMQNFHRDLSDGLVLIAVTAAYCPFLVDECFGNLYNCPRNKKEALHNATCLVTAWRKIRLGFMITPMQIINPNQVQMLMLVVHLFQALPTYVPLTKIKFNCPLSQVVTKQINVSNPTDNIVSYLLLFVNNANRFFTILKPVSVLRLNAYGSGQVQIQFHAKKIQKSKVSNLPTAYLLLCGRAVGPHFGRNQVIVLEGYIDNLGVAREYTIRSKLYEITETSLRIDVPYRNAAEYDIWMTEERPSNPLTLKMARWRELRAKKIPRRFFLNQNSIIVAEGASEAHLSISVACIVPEQRTFWLIFQAKTGDFIIQINSVWQTLVNDCIVVEWTARGECICSDQRRNACPFNVSLPIPSRNAQLRKCVVEMFHKTLESKERLFWSKYSGTHIELRLIRWLMGDDTDPAVLEFVHIFNTAVTYKVTISDKSSHLVVPEYFIIQDVRPSSQQVLMITHILPTAPALHETTITLTSLDGKELRVYTIVCLRS